MLIQFRVLALCNAYTVQGTCIVQCLYSSGYLHCGMLAHIMLSTTRAIFSQNRFSSQAGSLSAPVAFLGLRCPSVALTYSTDGVGGGTSFNWGITGLMSGTSVRAVSYQGLINACCSRSAKAAITSAGSLLVDYYFGNHRRLPVRISSYTISLGWSYDDLCP